MLRNLSVNLEAIDRHSIPDLAQLPLQHLKGILLVRLAVLLCKFGAWVDVLRTNAWAAQNVNLNLQCNLIPNIVKMMHSMSAPAM